MTTDVDVPLTHPHTSSQSHYQPYLSPEYQSTHPMMSLSSSSVTAPPMNVSPPIPSRNIRASSIPTSYVTGGITYIIPRDEDDEEESDDDDSSPSPSENSIIPPPPPGIALEVIDPSIENQPDTTIKTGLALQSFYIRHRLIFRALLLLIILGVVAYVMYHFLSRTATSSPDSNPYTNWGGDNNGAGTGTSGTDTSSTQVPTSPP